MESLLHQGRSATADRLSRTLASAPPPFLEGAIDNPRLSAAHVLLILRNPAVPSGVVARIAETRAWLRSYKVKVALVAHPKTPRVVAFLLLSTLGWRDLAYVSERPQVDCQIRRLAEGRLSACIEGMAQGERISLARVAQREIITALCHDEKPQVIRALLQNPRLRENDVLRIAANRAAPPGVLKTLSESDRFGRRREVQKSIACHPNCPSAVALRLLQELRSHDLKEILRGSRVPTLIRVATGRLLAGEAFRGPRRRPRRGSGS